MCPGFGLTNVAGDTPIDIVRNTSLGIQFSLVDGPQPVLPTDPTPTPTSLAQAGTYLLFLVKQFDTDPYTDLPIPDTQAIYTLDSRNPGSMTIANPATSGVVEITIPATATTQVDTFGHPAMPTGVTLRWSLKLFLGDGAGGVSSEHTPMAGPWTVWDRTVQS